MDGDQKMNEKQADLQQDLQCKKCQKLTADRETPKGNGYATPERAFQPSAGKAAAPPAFRQQFAGNDC